MWVCVGGGGWRETDTQTDTQTHRVVCVWGGGLGGGGAREEWDNKSK